MNSVLGENLEGLHQTHENQRSAPHSAQKCVPKNKKKSLLNSVLGESLEDLRKLHDHHAELECQRFCSIRIKEGDKTVTKASRGDVLEDDLGHVDNPLGNNRRTRGEETVNIRQLFHHLQHKSIKSLDQLIRDAVVPLHLPQRPGPQQCLWPLSPGGPAIVRGKFTVLDRSHPGAGDFLLAPWGVVRSAHLGARMVGHCSQHRSHRLLLVSPPRAQTALPSPPRGSAFNIHVNRLDLSVQVTTREMGTLESDALLLLFLTQIDETAMLMSTPLYDLIGIPVPSHLGVNSRRLRHPGEPSTTKNSSSSRARKTGAQLRHSRRSAKNDAKCVKKPIIAAISKIAGNVVPVCVAQLNVHINRR